MSRRAFSTLSTSNQTKPILHHLKCLLPHLSITFHNVTSKVYQPLHDLSAVSCLFPFTFSIHSALQTWPYSHPWLYTTDSHRSFSLLFTNLPHPSQETFDLVLARWPLFLSLLISLFLRVTIIYPILKQSVLGTLSLVFPIFINCVLITTWRIINFLEIMII